MTLTQIKRALPAKVRRKLNAALDLVNADLELQSYLYDLDLLPEQIDNQMDFMRFSVIVSEWKKRHPQSKPA